MLQPLLRTTSSQLKTGASTASSYPRWPLELTASCLHSLPFSEFLIKNEALPEGRIRAIETGGCPHAAIRFVPRPNEFIYGLQGRLC